MMADAEFEEVMDKLIARGIVQVAKKPDGELGFVLTEYGKQVAQQEGIWPLQ